MQVHHDEEVANRIDPESCAAAREGISEALTGDRTGQELSRESTLDRGAGERRRRKGHRQNVVTRIVLSYRRGWSRTGAGLGLHPRNKGTHRVPLLPTRTDITADEVIRFLPLNQP